MVRQDIQGWMKHVDIGNGCAIGTGSLVDKKFKSNCLIAGSPAKIVRDSIVWEDGL